MGLVTVFSQLTTTGAGELVVQNADEPRFAVDCRVKPVVFVGHVKMTFVPEGRIVSCGTGNERLNAVPFPEVPPYDVVPYRVLPDKINPALGQAPSLLV